jgi:hypothetical protein
LAIDGLHADSTAPLFRFIRVDLLLLLSPTPIQAWSRSMTEHQHEGDLARNQGPRPVEARDDELRHAEGEIAARLRDRGVLLTGRETGAELADLLDAVERFETVVENHGGDLMVDEPVRAGSPIAPDDEAFVLPRRQDGESVTEFIGRISLAIDRVRGKRG